MARTSSTGSIQSAQARLEAVAQHTRTVSRHQYDDLPQTRGLSEHRQEVNDNISDALAAAAGHYQPLIDQLTLKLKHDEQTDLLKKIEMTYTWATLASICSMEWAHIGHSMNQEHYLCVHNQIGLVNALMLSISAGLFFVSMNSTGLDVHGNPEGKSMLEKLYTFAWCASFLSFLTGMLLAVMNVVAASAIATDIEFQHFLRLIGGACKIPYLLLHLGYVLVWVGFLSYIILTFEEHDMWFFLISCSFFIFIYDYGARTIAMATHNVGTVHRAINASAASRARTGEDIYTELRHYFEQECSGKFDRICKNDFVGRFAHKYAIKKLAEKIFDVWFREFVDSQVRDAAGFSRRTEPLSSPAKGIREKSLA